MERYRQNVSDAHIKIELNEIGLHFLESHITIGCGVHETNNTQCGWLSQFHNARLMDSNASNYQSPTSIVFSDFSFSYVYRHVMLPIIR